MADSDQVWVGRCKRCGKLHDVVVVSSRTRRIVKEMERDDLTVEQMTVGEARPQLALMECSAPPLEAPDA